MSGVLFHKMPLTALAEPQQLFGKEVSVVS